MDRRLTKPVSSANATEKNEFAGEGPGVYGSYVDELLAILPASGLAADRKFAHSNHLYSVAAITDNSGTVIERYRYDTFGNRTVLAPDGTTVRTSSQHGNQVGFTGRYLDKETGLWYFRARYYSGSLGRFVGRDPLGYVDGMGLYNGYFAPNGVDPNGLAWKRIIEKKFKVYEMVLSVRPNGGSSKQDEAIATVTLYIEADTDACAFKSQVTEPKKNEYGAEYCPVIMKCVGRVPFRLGMIWEPTTPSDGLNNLSKTDGFRYWLEAGKLKSDFVQQKKGVITGEISLGDADCAGYEAKPGSGTVHARWTSGGTWEGKPHLQSVYEINYNANAWGCGEATADKLEMKLGSSIEGNKTWKQPEEMPQGK